MTSNDRKELINTLIRLIDDDTVLTQWERRDMLERVCGKLGGWSMEKHIQNSGNNRKLKIKRGTNTENNEYRGVCGEITMDTDEKTIRLHDGETVGGVAMARADSVPDMAGADYVVAWQNPTAENNYTWFRRYKSGWITQGGKLSGRSITFPIQFALLPTLTTCTVDADTNVVANNLISNIKTTGFDGFFQSANKDWIGPARDMNGYWTACGVTSE